MKTPNAAVDHPLAYRHSPRLRRQVSLSEAMGAIGDGARVWPSPYCATPTTLLRGLAQRSHEISAPVLSAGLLLGDLPCYDEIRTGRIRFRSWHLSSAGRKLAATGAVDYIPARAHDVARNLRRGVDIAVVRVTPPDAHGNCSLGPSASYTKSMLEAAKVRIAEVDVTMPRTRGDDVTFPYSMLDYVVESETPIVTYASAPESEVANAIAAHVLPLIPDGATLQLGIGPVPEAVARCLARSDVRDLGLVGLVGDSLIDLLESGTVAAAPDAVRAVELLGTSRLFDYADRNDRIEMRSSHSIHNPLWLARLAGLVSVCSALEVDLTGQVASEQAGGRVIAGVGGSADFFEGASLSPGGVRIVALPSLTPRGESRIKPMFGPGTPISLARHSVDYVVTEHGVARLSGASTRERSDALLAVAHPRHRDSLTTQSPELGPRN